MLVVVFHPDRMSRECMCVSSYPVHGHERRMRSADDGSWGEDWMDAWFGMRMRGGGGKGGGAAWNGPGHCEGRVQ